MSERCSDCIVHGGDWECDHIHCRKGQLPSAQPEPCDDVVSRKAVEHMLQNGLPARGMWEIEGDVVKQTVCETLADALMDLEKLPSAQPQRTGHWIEDDDEMFVTCSECGEKNDYISAFCPDCGAKMINARGEQEGE